MEQRTLRTVGRPAWAGWIACAAMAIPVLIVLAHPGAVAEGEVREIPPPQAFLSGGARTEPILREIAETLKRIDGRLEKLERAVYAANSETTEHEETSQPKQRDQ